jgi:hypothetical protein
VDGEEDAAGVWGLVRLKRPKALRKRAKRAQGLQTQVEKRAKFRCARRADEIERVVCAKRDFCRMTLAGVQWTFVAIENIAFSPLTRVETLGASILLMVATRSGSLKG